MKLLHVTAHLGGGIGKVLSRLVEASARRVDGIEHTIACLEQPEKTDFVDYAKRHGATILCAPNDTELDAHIRTTDIVQLEWWHHPVVARWMSRTDLPAMRLLVWAHVSGRGTPVIPSAFLGLPHRFLFSSSCSLELIDPSALSDIEQGQIGNVFSSGGFEDLPEPPARGDITPPRIGYLGTLDFAKLHPELLDFIAAVRPPGFRLDLYGDPTTGEALLADTRARGMSERIAICGYTHQVADILASMDVMAYLLNPEHYGTAENALLEAMAMGVVPVVLDNPAEQALVRHDETGLVVRNPSEFAEAIARLTNDPTLRRRLSANAARDIRARFPIARTADALAAHYQTILDEDKRHFDFRAVFGNTPADWFLACQPPTHPAVGNPNPSTQGLTHRLLLERNKGSVFHYARTFPTDTRLAALARQLGTKQ